MMFGCTSSPTPVSIAIVRMRCDHGGYKDQVHEWIQIKADIVQMGQARGIKARQLGLIWHTSSGINGGRSCRCPSVYGCPLLGGSRQPEADQAILDKGGEAEQRGAQEKVVQPDMLAKLEGRQVLLNRLQIREHHQEANARQARACRGCGR